MLAVIGALALGGASVARAQDTSKARPDTSGYKGYDSTRTDSAGFKYTGPPTDTALKAKPGAQTGPTAADTGKAAGDTGKAAGAGMADTVVCKDGSNAAAGQSACSAHGGIDSAATKAAKKARGMTEQADSTKQKSP
jgi:hypothetical protein